MLKTPFIATHEAENAHNGDIFALSTCKRYTCSGSGDGRVLLWDNLRPGEAPVELVTVPAGIHHVACGEDGQFLAATDFTGKVTAWNLDSLEKIEIQELNAIKDAWACAVQYDKLVVSTLAGNIFVFCLSEKKQIFTLPASKNLRAVCCCVDITKDASMVVAGFDSGRVILASLQTFKTLYSISCGTLSPRVVKFAPGGTMFAVAGDNDTITLFTTNGGDLVGSLLGHESWIFDLTWSTSGEFLSSASQDRTAKVWNIENRSCVYTMTDSDKPLFAIAWMPSGWTQGQGREGIVTGGVERNLRWYRQAGVA